jgi:Carbohydrate esterase, sialic acid-specific acetylesterase/SGNH hydrolase-like domain, acetyltransferase AlgX
MRKFLAILFVSLLIVPTAAWILELDFGIAINRLGLKFPQPYGRAFLEKEYYRAFDQYFDDSFSMRGPLMLAKNWIDFKLFRTTDTTDVHIGRDGWLYGRTSITDYSRADHAKKADMERLALQLHAIEKIVTASGRHFLFIVAPAKAIVYPEFLGLAPEFFNSGRSQLDLFLGHLDRHPLKSYIPLDEVLKAAKSSRVLLYDKAHAHWNGLGALVAAESIYHRIYDDAARPGALDYIATRDDGIGDLGARLMGLSAEIVETPFQRLAGSSRSDLPAGILYGDLFQQNLSPYLLQIFKQLDVVQADRVPSIQHKEDWLAYQYILLESAQTELQTLNIDLDRIFSMLDPEAQSTRRIALDLTTVAPVSQTSLANRPDGLEIKSLGRGSAFELPDVAASNNHIFRVLKLSLAARQSDRMTIQYRTPLLNAVYKIIKPGITEFFLPLPFQETVSIRFFPGDKAGLIVLRSAELIEFSDRPATVEPPRKEIIEADESPGAGESLPVESRIAETSEPEADPDLSSEPEILPKQDLFAKADSEISNQSDIPPDHDQIVEDRTPPRFDKKQPDEAGDKVSGHERKSAAIATVPESENVEPTAKPDSSVTLPGNMEGSVDVKPIVSEKLKKPDEDPPSITLTDFEDGRIFQRKNRRADIIVSGTYTGAAASIEARVVGADGSEEIVPWTIIDNSPQNGIFVGVLAGVPQGGWYNLQVRFGRKISVSDKGSHQWGVGILIACLGQSNMKEWFHAGESFKAHPMLRKYSHKGWSAPGSRGNGALAFGNRLVESLGIPVGLLDFAVNGSGLRKEADWGTGYWENTAPGSIYARFVAGVSKAGGALEFVVWFQGEADAARKTVTEAEYRDSLTSFITNQVRADIANGSDREHLPFLVIMMTRRPGGADEPHQAIRNAQKYVAENVPECYLAATTLDLKNRGKQHMQPDAYTAMGARVAQTVLYILGKATYYRGPTATAAKQINDRRIDVSIEHRSGSDFTPVDGISGWEVLVNETVQPIVEVKRLNPTTISITLENPLTAGATIRYLYGAMPDTRNPVVDNSALSLPLEPYQAQVQ